MKHTAVLSIVLLIVASAADDAVPQTEFEEAHTASQSKSAASDHWSFARLWPWGDHDDSNDPGCVEGVCQTTPMRAIYAAYKMNVAGPAKYFWDVVNKATGTFQFAGDQTAHVSFAKVKKMMQDMPEQFNKEQVFKPNDLGLLRLNGEIWSYEENPDIALAMNKEMHAFARPIVMELFANETEWSVDAFASDASKLFEDSKAKGELTQDDISTWSQQMLHKYGLKHPIGKTEAAAFQKYAQDALKNSIAPKMIFNFLTRKALKTAEVKAQNAAYIKKYAGIAKKRCPLRDFSDEESELVGHGLIDGALTFAGGLSVPGIITSMLGVLYSGEHGNFAHGNAYKTAAYAWEVARYYPAVVGVPFVKTDTTKREVLLLPSALTDPKVWGKDADKFVLRKESVYKGNIDMAWNGFMDSKKYPNESRSCPGMAMSKAMLLGFMKAFDHDKWTASEKPKTKALAPVKWNGFVLKYKK